MLTVFCICVLFYCIKFMQSNSPIALPQKFDNAFLRLTKRLRKLSFYRGNCKIILALVYKNSENRFQFLKEREEKHREKIYIIFLFIIFTCISLSLIPSAHAAIYDNCIYSYEFADVPRKNVIVRAIGDVCHDRCQTECDAMSRKYNGQELNQDIIDRCTVECRKGNLYSIDVREPFLDQRTGGNLIYKMSSQPPSTATHCAKSSGAVDSADFIVYRSGITITKDDEFMIDLIAPPGFEGNVVYLCGRQTTYLDVHQGNFSEINVNNRSIWEARNPYFFDTGIAPRDGDYLSITYQGKFNFDCNQNCTSCYGKPKCICPGDTCKPDARDFNLLIRDPKNPGAWNNSGSEILPGGELNFITSQNAPAPGSGTGSQSDDYPVSNAGSVQAYNENLQKAWKGLAPNIYPSYEPHYDTETRHVVFSGYLGIPLVREDDSIIPSYNFDNISGASSYSPRHARLGLKHYDTSGVYGNNQGGFYGEVSWKGCSQFKGNRLQYTTVPANITNDQIDISKLEWIDLDVDDIMDPVKFKLDSKLQDGEITLRVKPFNSSDYASFMIDCNPNTDPNCNIDSDAMQAKYNEYNAFGQFYVSVTKIYSVLKEIEKVSDAIRKIRSYFFGDGTNDGLMQFIYKSLVSDTTVMDIIRAVLIFYIAFTGFSFMIGISPITQREGAIRLLKIGLVLMLISENSWDFFYNGFFKIFLEGMTEIIANIATPIYLPDSEIREKIIQDGANVFMVFDEPLRILFSSITWKKILGLMMTNFLGFLLAIVLGISCVITILVLIKALIIYITALVVLSILVMLSPIFITLILFGYTKQMFDNWLKQLIVYTLQPIFVFTAISLLLHLLIIGVKMALSFTICETCVLGFIWPFGADDNYVCLIPGYTTLFGAHMPSQAVFSMPLANVGILLYLLIVSQAMYAFCGFATKLAILIGSGQFVGFDLGQVAQSFRSIGFITESVSSSVGLDSTSSRIRQSRRRG